MNTGQTILAHSRADRSLRSLLEDSLSEFDVTLMEWLLLDVINKGPDDGLSMSAVSRELDVTLPQVTALMTGVVKKKLVKLKTQRNDRRSRHALLTAKGRQVQDEAGAAAATTVQGWFNNVPKDQLDVYLRVVNLLAFAGRG